MEKTEIVYEETRREGSQESFYHGVHGWDLIFTAEILKGPQKRPAGAWGNRGTDSSSLSPVTRSSPLAQAVAGLYGWPLAGERGSGTGEAGGDPGGGDGDAVAGEVGRSAEADDPDWG